MDANQIKTHVMILGWLYIVFSAFLLLAAAFVFLAVVGGGLISGDRVAIQITGLVGTLVSGFLVLLSLPGLIAGVGLLRQKQWARILALVMAVLNLTAFPVGTAIAIYAFWVLLSDASTRLFASA